MSMVQVHIHQQPAKIGMTHERPPMQITQRPADLDIQQELQGTLEMSTTDPVLRIDQSAAFADADVKSILVRNEEHANRANQNVLSYIAKVVQDGDALRSIENGGNPIAALAEGRGLIEPRQVTYAAVPSGTEKVRIDFTPSELTIRSDWPDPQINVQVNEPEITIPRWELSIYQQQKNQISFEAVGGSVDRGL
ncbi:DUF6470 family protein [Alkalicoccus urumqiensis]|uniref:Uncharacterized protein n=1 Tax=Alkalicoccus urumqiensis TaxID=1548213 RepID=A0A2P6MHA0_ALKUR|nr:DUF6470 family protein [Alkalicoccus urumqiensis]PRO65662.1 hypothetical protein C6I21_09065 [Alkalicoccus urumqiensis]